MKKNLKTSLLMIFLGIVFILTGIALYSLYFDSYESKDELYKSNLNDCVNMNVSLQVKLGPPITKEMFKKIKEECNQS